MSTQKIDHYAHENNISNSEAKRRLKGRGSRADEPGSAAPARGGPVAGTGKPKGASK